MKRALILAAMILLTGSFAFGQTKDKKSARDLKVEQELRNLVRAWDDATVRGDVKTLDRLLADEFSFVGGATKSEYLASIKNRQPEMVIESAVSDQLEVQVYEEMAILTGVDTIRVKEKGESKTRQWLYMDVWIKRDGRWQCVKTYSSLKGR
ncbi:MAG TPA: nuclear transport factor 2 family protein [Pyrinomonadaceae bacterium]|jgi:ketosteroid isomerase-like protein